MVAGRKSTGDEVGAALGERSSDRGFTHPPPSLLRFESRLRWAFFRVLARPLDVAAMATENRNRTGDWNQPAICVCSRGLDSCFLTPEFAPQSGELAARGDSKHFLNDRDYFVSSQSPIVQQDIVDLALEVFDVVEVAPGVLGPSAK